MPTAVEDFNITTDYYHNANWQVVEERLNEQQEVFGGDGILWLNGYPLNAVTVDAEGRLVVAGTYGGDFFVARLTADGDFDTTFSGDGKATANFGYTDVARSVTIDSEGRIVVAGDANSDFAVARFEDDGDLDTTFSGDGKAMVNFGSTDYCYAVAVDSDDRVVLAGYSYVSGSYDFSVARLTEAGALDATFSGDGKVTANFGSTDYGRAVAIDADDRVLVAGQAYVSGSSGDFALARFTEAGALDTTFGEDENGLVTLAVSTGVDSAYAMVLDLEGRIVLGGLAETGDYAYDFVLARFTDDGLVDDSFGDEGLVGTDIGTDYLRALAVDSRGRIVAAGYSNMGATTYDFSAARYLDDGRLDPSFGGDGTVTTAVDSSPFMEYALSVAVDAADRVILAGYRYSNGILVRYNPDGTLTTSTTQYVPSPRYIDAVICRDTSDGDTLQDGSRVYYLSDANHNVTALVDAAGEVVERYTYTPYGQVTIYDGTWSATYATSIIDNATLYTGRVYDGAIDLYNFRARWYDAGVGQFTTRDPMGYAAGD